MSLFEKTIYPQLSLATNADELALYFTPTEDELAFTVRGARRASSRLRLLVLLKLFQHLHRFPASSEVPAALVDHLRIHLQLGPAVRFELSEALQRARHRNAIRKYTGVKAWCSQARHLAATTGFRTALVMARPADIANAIIADLTHSGFELPPLFDVKPHHQTHPGNRPTEGVQHRASTFDHIGTSFSRPTAGHCRGPAANGVSGNQTITSAPVA